MLELPSATGDGDRFAGVRESIGELRALAAGDDFIALELMLLCSQAGRTPGRNIAIIGQGNEMAAGRVTPGLTTIDFSGEEIGSRAVELVLQRVAKTRQDASQHAYVPPVLVERDSARLSG